MPFPIAEIRERTKTSTKHYRNSPYKLTLTYRLDRFTVDENSAFQDELNVVSRKDAQGNMVTEDPNKQLFARLSEQLQELIVAADWEDDWHRDDDSLIDAEGRCVKCKLLVAREDRISKPIPIDAEEMRRRLPSGVLLFASEMISEGMAGKK